MDISQLPRTRAFPGKACDLCGHFIYYGEDIRSGRKIAFDQKPVYNHAIGEIALIDPELVDDNPHVIKFVPENERWMHEVLFTTHRSTCIAWAECQDKGLDFETCKRARAEENAKKPFLTQTLREGKEPGKYSSRRT